MQKLLLGNWLSLKLVVVLLALLSSSLTWAQSTANYAFATNSTGSLVDMSSGTTDALATGTYRDDVASTVQPIGFTFVFMGTAYTQFSVNSNGQLQFGATAISGTAVSPTANLGILAPFGGDNAIQATGKVYYKVVAGTNRTLVVEWNSLRIPFSSTAATGSVVQAILEENTGKVEYRYGTVYNNSTSITRPIFISAGTAAGKIGVVKTFTTTPTYDATVTTATTTALTDNAAVPVLSSTADGSRTVFTFTPTAAAPAAPTLAFSALTQTSLSVDITDNSTNEYTFAVYRSTDNVTFTLLGSVATASTTGTGTTVSLVQTGLVAGTQYYYRVTANSEGVPSVAATASATTPAAVPICGTKSVGPAAGADYPTLTAAFAALTNNGLCGPLVLELQAAYVSTTETFPIVYNYAGTTATNTVTVRPAAGATGLSITGTTAAAVFNIVGGKYLLLDGRPGGSGSPVSGAALATDLTIASTSTSGIPLQFTSDATFNTVQHCQVKGVGTSDYLYPDVNFTGTVTTTGNSDNVVQYNNIGDGATTPVTLVYSGNALNARNTVSNNNLFNFYNSSSAAYGLEVNQAGAGWVISGNSIYQTAARTSVAYTTYGIYIAGGNGHTVSGNFIGGSAASVGSTAWTTTGTSAAFRFVGIYLTTSGAATSVQGNTIANFAWQSSSGATTTYGIWGGIYVSSGDANIGTATGNLIGTASGPVSVTTSTTLGNSFGISTASSGTVSIVGNTISNLTGVGTTASIASNTVGILASAGTANTISRNKIYNLAAGSGAANQSIGISLTGGTLNTVVNNLIGDLRAATSTSLLAVAGVVVTGGTTSNLYYNTINLAATSTGTTFGTSGIYLNSTSATLDLRNNIVVNKSTAVGTGGYTAALRRVSGTAGTVPSNLAATTNNNLYYAGAPSATNLIYVEGTTTATNAQQTLLAYQAFTTTRESNSVTEDVPFLSTVGTAATFLHINPATATQVESGGTPISGITTDFDGDTRSTTTPDLGADEGTFTPQDLSGPLITYTALGITSSTANRTLAVTITDPSGVATGANAPRLYYRKGIAGAYVFVNATSVSGSTYTFTFDYSLIGGVAGFDVIQYYVAAQDAVGNASTSPLTGSGATPPGTTAPATPNQYQIQGTLAGTYYVGTSTSPAPARTYATLTAAVSAYNTNLLGGAVTFVLLDATYSTAETFPITINANADASATNTLTIKPNTGVTATITGSVATGAVLKLNGADYVTIDGSNAGTTTQNLTITNASATGSGNAVLWLAAASATDGATNNTVKNTLLTGNSAAGFPQFTVFLGGGGAGVTAPTTSTPAANSSNTLTNNVITKGYYGVFMYGVSATVLDQNNIVSGNQIGQVTSGTGFGLEGLRAIFQQNLTVQANEIQGVVSTAAASHFGMNLGTLKNSLIDRNSIHDVQSNSTTSGYVGYGISLASTALNTSANASANTVSNNIIYNISAPLATTSSNPNVLGIANGGGYGDKIYFNTVLLNGAQTAGTGYSAAISNGDSQYNTATSALDVRNNIFAITANVTTTAKYFGFYTSAANVTGSTLDYNDYYLGGSGSATFAVGNLNGTSLASSATLAAWQTATSQEANSKSVAPGFVQTTTVPYNLTPTSAVLNSAGVTIAGITTDYAGATRTSPPDIGAIEFTPPACQAVTNLASTNLTATSVSITFTAPSGGASANSYTVTYAPAGGTAITVTPNPTASPIALTGLTPSTIYTVTVTTNCTGATSPSSTITFTTPCAPPVYATLPASEGFENTWLSRCDTREVPSANWLNTPATGNPSWRRDDDGAAANWSSPATGAYTPAGSQGSSHSARFHSYYASSGAVGTLDLYANLSVAGPKRLTFDYVNVSTAGSKLDVLLSTDGGVTFSTTPLLTIATATTFTTQTVDLTATSATAVIRFQATSDFGSYDIGVDNVLLRSLPSVDIAPVALVTPASTQTCYGSTETIAVSVSNQGSAALNFAANPATVTAVVATPGGPQTLTGTITTGTLAAGATQTVTLSPTLDMTAVGTYSFAITATATGDAYTANDVLTPTPTRTVAAPVAGTLFPAATSICIGGTVTLTLTGAANGSVQYQRSADNVTFTDVAGATSASYTTPVLTTTTYYRAQVRCNTGTVTSNVATLTVNNPQVASTNTPVAACAGSPATLMATPATGSSVRFFTTATGGPALTSTGTNSYTTPALTANTTYYAEAYTIGQEPAGKPSTTGADGTNNAGGLYFTTTSALTLANVTVYQVANSAAVAGTVYLIPGSSTTTANAIATYAVSLPASTVAAVTPTVLPLNFAIPAAGSYTLYFSASTTTYLVRDTPTGTAMPTTAYPYTSPSGAVSITGGTLTGYYYFFYNWQTNSECVSATRTAIQVNVTPAPVATFSYPATGSNCAGSTGTVAPTLATGATAGTFTSTTGLTINATTGVVNLATSTAGTYTVTNTVAATGACPATPATATITVNPTPARPTITPTYNGTQTTLTSSSATGNQFYYNGVAIAGATGQTYVVNGSASTYGSYTVVVTNSFGCSSQASVVQVVTATKGSIAGASIQLFPNPTPDGRVTLELSGFRSATQLVVLDALGRVVSSEQLPATTGVVTHSLDLSRMASGVYLLRLTNAEGVETRRLTRE